MKFENYGSGELIDGNISNRNKKSRGNFLPTMGLTTSIFYLGITPIFNTTYLDKTSSELESIDKTTKKIIVGRDNLNIENPDFDKCEIPIVKSAIETGYFSTDAKLEKYSSFNSGTLIRIFVGLNNGNTGVNPYRKYRVPSTDKDTWNCYRVDVSYNFFPPVFKSNIKNSQNIEEKLDIPIK